jgi:outer membrane lipoprotein carrier protein
MKTIIIVLLSTYISFADTLILPQSFKANFTQMITNTKEKTIHYEGKVYFSDKVKFKWAYTKPTQKEVCTDSFGLLVVDHDLEQISEYTMDKEFNLANIVKAAKPHRENVYVSNFDGKTVTIQVDHKKRLHSIAYYDSLDNKVQIIFKQVQYTKGKLARKMISCAMPKAYDHIRG